METDYWAHRYAENPPTDEVEDGDFDADAIERQWAEQAGDQPDDFETIIDSK